MSAPAPASIAAIVAAVMRELARTPTAQAGALLTSRQAAAYLAISLRALQSRADIPRVNIAPPGSERAMWRYCRADLDQLIAMRTIAAFDHEPAA
jgi:hypothetical protein